MNSSRKRHGVWAWLLCALLFWLTASPPYCDLCYAISVTVTSAHQSLSIPIRLRLIAVTVSALVADFYGLPKVGKVIVPVNVVLADTAPESPRPAFALGSTIFRPPQVVAS
jgi:hypothetical protein